ncbi:MAG: tRNA (adenine-N1)-methyltransferase [candidate division WOR-3 bacterium]
MLKPGDFVLLYHSERMKYLLELKETGRFSTHRGWIEFSQMLGRDYGDCVKTQLNCWFHLLKPTIADLLLKVRRTTTIVYPKDTGLMLLETVVFPGARVIETGSGSGGLTSVLAWFVRPTGRVYSYERRSEFSENARANVERYGLGQFCEFFVQDPETRGFEQTDVDAVFLDVPEPWTLVRAAHRSLRGGHPLAAIVPTAEQLSKLSNVMELEGFVRVRSTEILKRDMLVRAGGTRPADRMIGHTVYIVLGHKSNQSVSQARVPMGQIPAASDAE